MQNKKQVSVRNSSRENASARDSRPRRKVSENVQVAEKKAAELITTSARKQKSAGLLKTSSDSNVVTNLNTISSLQQEETSIICLGPDAVYSTSLDFKDCDMETGHRVLETILSPAFHISIGVGGEIANGVDFSKFLHDEGQKFSQYSDTDSLKNRESGGPYHFNKNTITSISSTSSCNLEVETEMSASANPNMQNCSQMFSSNSIAADSPCNDDSGAKLPLEVSSLDFTIKNSRLECVDEDGHDSMPTGICVEDDEEFDEFDPYVFIKGLPELSSVVSTFRPVLLPKQTRSCPSLSLVLDLDETLVHSTLEPCDDADFSFPVNYNLLEHVIYVKCRPHLKAFMERIAGVFEVIIFTASQSIYADQLLNVLDPKRRIFRYRFFRESCVFFDGNYLKDLSVLGRDLSRVVIIDNSPQAFGFQVDNGIPIESWFDDPSDQELLLLLPFLESLLGTEDVRPLIAEKFNTREKVAAAVCRYSVSRDVEEFT